MVVGPWAKGCLKKFFCCFYPLFSMGGMFRNELTNVFFWGALEYILEISMNQAVE